MMNRRDALRLLSAGAAIPLLPHTLLAALREARAGLGPATAPRTLNAHQDATVRTMAEMIIPRTDTPGAADAGVAEFIDLLLTEWYDEPERTIFLKGLDHVDQHTQALFGENFVDCSSSQQSETLTWLGQQIADELEQEREHPRSLMETEPRRLESFYLMFRRLTLTAYYTSEVGAEGELHFEIIPDRYEGCAEVQSAKGEPPAR